MLQRIRGLALSAVAVYMRRKRVAVAMLASTTSIARRVSIATFIATISHVSSRTFHPKTNNSSLSSE